VKRQITRALVICRPLASVLAGVTLLGAAPTAIADPDQCSFHDQRLCNPSKTAFCPDTGTFVTFMQLCPSLVIGPHRAGMPDDN